MLNPMTQPLVLDGQGLSIDDVASVARGDRPVRLGGRGREALERSRAVVERALQTGEAIYGVNTGFGSLARQRIAPEQVREVQRNLIRSHSAGVGEALSESVVRSMLLLLAASLCRGCSGVRPVVVERLLDLLNHRVAPVVPSRGSVGASGDLAPLAHGALVLTGEGHVMHAGAYKPAGKALADAGLQPIALEAKEGLALINGTHLMTSLACLALHDLDRLIDAAVLANAMMIDACLATDAFLDDRLHAARGQAGQRAVAARLRECLAGSEIIPSHKVDDPRVQDPYSLRCSPQILGAVVDMLGHARAVVERELGGVSDNPLVFAGEGGGRDAIISGGNFHGLPLALAMDAATIAVAHVAGVSERRIYYLLAASDSENPLNAHLSPQPGLHSGMMIAQYTAAACCNEIQTLSAPASVANIPTSAGQEDYNSFGPNAGFKLRRAVELATHVIAIEVLCAAEALEYHRPLRSGAVVEEAHEMVRRHVPRLVADRPMTTDIESIVKLIRAGRLGR